MIGTVLCIYETSCDKLDNKYSTQNKQKYSCFTERRYYDLY